MPPSFSASTMRLKFDLQAVKAHPWYYGFAALCVLLLAAIMFLVPRSNDEYHFLGEQFEICRDQGLTRDNVLTPYVVWDLIKGDYMTDNARIFNLIGIALLGAPQWLWGLIKFASMWLMTHFMLAIAGVRRGQTQKLIWTVFLIVFGIGWEYGLLAALYIVNYISTGALLLWVVKLFLDRKLESWWCLPLGFILGACHESFGLAFFGGSIVAGIFHRKLLTRGYLLTLAGCVLGLAWLMLAPCWGSSHHVTTIRIQMAYYLSQIWYVPLYLVGWAILLLFKRSRRVAMAPLPLFTLGTMPLVVVGCFGFKTRAALPCNILAICSTIWIVSTLASPTVARRLWAKTASAVAGAIILFHLAAVARASYLVRIANEAMDRACAEHVVEARKTGAQEISFFLDVPQPWDLPWYTLRRPFNEHFRAIRAPGRARAHAYELEYIFPLPTALRGFSPEKAVPVPSQPGLWFYNGLLVGPAELAGTNFAAMVDYPGAEDYSDVTAIAFKTDAGVPYSFLFVDRNLRGCFEGDPVDIHLYDAHPRLPADVIKK